ncbi:MAG: hypothetical protein IT385_07885 [Deltaproteobacteria bacterium]|nr:hypothetical protein [Deltaproteobacteria bacterium]
MSARAEEPALAPPDNAPPPLLFHAPESTARAGEQLAVVARVLAEARLETLWVEVRPAAGAEAHAVFDRFDDACREGAGIYEAERHACRFELKRRTSAETFGVVVPGELVQPPGISYTLLMRTRAGDTEAAFATPERPHPVLVHGETAATRRADRLERHRGHTSRVALRSDATFFGPARVDAAAGEARSEPFSDRYGSVEVDYTSRPLTTVYAFRLGLGLMRGQRATVEQDGRETSTGSGPEPGLNYGYGEIDFEVGRIFYLTPRLTLGASEAGFAAGVGASATIGRPTTTRLVLGVDWVSGLGARGWLTFAWTTVPGFPMGLTVELTEHPDNEASALGSRLLYDLGIEIGESFELGLRVGYAQRATSFDGGFVVGLGGSWDF